MNDDKFEKTRALNDLSDLIPKEEAPIENTEEPIAEQTEEELYQDLVQEESPIQEPENDNNKKKKEGLGAKFKKLSKGKKIFIILLGICVILAAFGITLFILLRKEAAKPVTPKEPENVFEADNYIYEDGKLKILNLNGVAIGTYECQNKNEKLCYVAYLDNDEDTFNSVIDKYEDGSIVKFRSKVFLNKFVFITDKEKEDETSIKLYNLEENKVLDTFKKIKYSANLNNQVILETTDDKYGLYGFGEMGLNEVIKPTYKYLGAIDDNYLVVKNDKGTFLIDYNNNFKTQALNGNVISYNKDYIILANNNKYSLYNYSNKELLSGYDFISLIDKDYVACVNNDGLYIMNTQGIKYNNDAIALNNKSYIKTIYYNKDKEKTKEEYAYEAEFINNTIKVKIGTNGDPDTYDVNLKEGEAASKYKYYSYSDGKLYFYSDEAKTKLLGTYICNNKNNISDDLTYNNCYVAKDSIFSDNYKTNHTDRNAVIPLFNNRYVFINDTNDMSKQEIKFYDLVSNKTIGTYEEIDANTEDNDSLTLVNENKIQIIGKFASGKMGTIVIENSKASVGFKFEYNKIERFGDYFLIQNADNNWQVVYSNGDKSYEFTNKIMDINDNFAVVKSSDGVKLYTLGNKEIDGLTDSFDYIKLVNNKFVACVKNNNLSIYRIVNNRVALQNKEPIQLITSNYFGNTPSFKVKINEAIEVSVYNGKEYKEAEKISIIDEYGSIVYNTND